MIRRRENGEGNTEVAVDHRSGGRGPESSSRAGWSAWRCCQCFKCGRVTLSLLARSTLQSGFQRVGYRARTRRYSSSLRCMSY
jgi:hypothetical protein